MDLYVCLLQSVRNLETRGQEGPKKSNSTYIHQTETRHHLPLLPLCRAPAGTKRPRRAARVDEELVHVLEALEAVGAAPAEHIDVELVGLGEEEVGLVGDERETLEETDSQGAVRNDLGQRERGRLDVKAALDDLEVGRYRAEVLVGWLVGQVTQTEGLGDFARGEELFELQGWQGVNVCGRYILRSGEEETEDILWGGCREHGPGCGGPLSRG